MWLKLLALGKQWEKTASCKNVLLTTKAIRLLSWVQK